MRWILLIAMLLFQWAASPLFCQALKHAQPHEAVLAPHASDSILPPKTEVSNSEAFYGRPHLLTTRTQDGMLNALPLNTTNDDWKVFVIVLTLLLLAIARFFFSSRIGHFFRASFGIVSFNQMEREGGFFNEALTYLLFFNYLVVFSILVYLSVDYFHASPEPQLLNPFLLFVAILLLCSAFFLAKSLLMGFAAWVFDTRSATTAYLKNIFLFNQLAGIALLAPAIYLSYNPSVPGFMITWLIWVLINLIKIVRGALIGYKVSAFSGYYLILYLCSVELAPLLLIIKAGSKYFLTA